MNVEVRAMKTSAEQALAAAYAAARGTLPGKGAVAKLREAAFARFDVAGLPHRRVEEWKYTDLRALMRDAYPLAAPPDAAVALNTALMGDGAVIRVADGSVIERPIHLVFAAGSDKPSAAFPRSLIVVGKGARITLVEEHDSGSNQVNAALELVVGDEAEADYFKITQAQGLHVASLLASVGAKAKFNTFAFTCNSSVVRNQCFIRFAGEGTHAGIRGVSLLRGKEHVDTTLLIGHAKGHCESREQFRSVLDGDSHGVFQGKIVVEPHAQKTDAKMMTRALLLSDEAEADNKPELEIFADDVVCGHGATAGALDPGLKFYLMSRGISEQEAEALLIQAFIGETVEEIAHQGIRGALMTLALDWLKRRG